VAGHCSVTGHGSRCDTLLSLFRQQLLYRRDHLFPVGRSDARKHHVATAVEEHEGGNGAHPVPRRQLCTDSMRQVESEQCGLTLQVPL